MARRILLTGASGFIGSHLLDILRREIDPSALVLASRHDADSIDDVRHVRVDLLDEAACLELVRSVRPDLVIHLAGAAAVGGTAGAEASVWANNVVATFHLASALRDHGHPQRFLFASSAEVYGRAFQVGHPLREDAPTEPTSVYGRTKLAAELLLKDVLGPVSEVLALRLFNSIGPRQDDRFVAGAFASQLARMERGAIPPVLKVGNLEARRDFVDVRDTARAIAGIALRDRAWPKGFTAVNIAGGTATPIDAIVTQFAALSETAFDVALNPDKLRPSEIPIAYGDSAFLSAETGWAPQISFEQSLSDVLDWWRSRAAVLDKV